MTTERQIEANRQNAQYSTGANTPEGQARSKMNALRWGFNAQEDVLPWESKEDYKDHRQSVFNRYNPQDDTEVYLVRRIASAEWRLFRIDRVEAMIYEACADNTLLLMAEITRLYQNENRLERVRTRALKELNEHRRDKAAGGQSGGGMMLNFDMMPKPSQQSSSGYTPLEMSPEEMLDQMYAQQGAELEPEVREKVLQRFKEIEAQKMAQNPPSSVMAGGNLSQQVQQPQAPAAPSP